MHDYGSQKKGRSYYAAAVIVLRRAAGLHDQAIAGRSFSWILAADVGLLAESERHASKNFFAPDFRRLPP